MLAQRLGLAASLRRSGLPKHHGGAVSSLLSKHHAFTSTATHSERLSLDLDVQPKRGMAIKYPSFEYLKKQEVLPRKIRIAHVTDLHWMDLSFPSWKYLTFKRLVGYTNIHLLGRKKMFSDEVRTQVIDKIAELKPDVVLITGDLTSVGLPSEFQMAHRGLAKLLYNFPTYIIPGNHDTYTVDSLRQMYRQFGEWMSPRPKIDWPTAGVFTWGDLVVLTVNSSVPRMMSSRGQFDRFENNQIAKPLNRRDHTLAHPDDELLLPHPLYTHWKDRSLYLRQKYVVFACHYPLLSAEGVRYDLAHKSHSAMRTDSMITTLQRAWHKPHLIIHGHDHMGYSVPLDNPPISYEVYENLAWNQPDRDPPYIPIHNPGSGALAYHEPTSKRDWHRVAAFNMYTAQRHTIGTWSMQHERYVHNGEEVVKEAEPYMYKKYGMEGLHRRGKDC